MNVLLCGIMCTLDENYICLFLYVFLEFYEAWDHFFGAIYLEGTREYTKRMMFTNKLWV